jgi:hypothetical protein
MILKFQPIDRQVEAPASLTFFDNDRYQFFVFPLIRRGAKLSELETKLHGNGRSLGLFTTGTIRSMKPVTMKHLEFGTVTMSLGNPEAVCCSERQFTILQQVFVLLMNNR